MKRRESRVWSRAAAAGLCLLVAVSSVVASADASDESQVRAGVERWFRAWSPGNDDVDFDALETLFAPGKISVIDDFGGDVVEMSTFEEYRGTWEPAMRGFSEWRVSPASAPEVLVASDLATAVFRFNGTGRLASTGARVREAQAGTHIWRKLDGGWRIVREHLTSLGPDDEAKAADVAAVEERTHDWISGWRTSPQRPFSLQGLEHIYARDETFTSLDFGRPHGGFDNLASAATYYEKFMAVPHRWKLDATTKPRVFVRGLVAWSKVSLRAEGELRDGAKISAPESRVTLIF